MLLWARVGLLADSLCLSFRKETWFPSINTYFWRDALPVSSIPQLQGTPS